MGTVSKRSESAFLDLAGLYGISEVKPRGVLSDMLGRRPVRLRLHKLQTDEECSALSRLKVNWGGKQKMQKEFQRLVLAHLSIIGRIVSSPRERQRFRQKRSECLRAMTRRAGSVRTFARTLKTGLSGVDRMPGNLLPLALPIPPVRQLIEYAEHLESLARMNKRPTPPPRRKTRPETPDVLNLIALVRTHTGSAHFPELAILLARPLRERAETGLIAGRLRSLEKDSHKKRKGWVSRAIRRSTPVRPTAKPAH